MVQALSRKRAASRFREALLTFMQQHGMEASGVADLLSCPTDRVYRWLSLRQCPSRKDLAAICEVLGWDSFQLFSSASGRVFKLHAGFFSFSAINARYLEYCRGSNGLDAARLLGHAAQEAFFVLLTLGQMGHMEHALQTGPIFVADDPLLPGVRLSFFGDAKLGLQAGFVDSEYHFIPEMPSRQLDEDSLNAFCHEMEQIVDLKKHEQKIKEDLRLRLQSDKDAGSSEEAAGAAGGGGESSDAFAG